MALFILFIYEHSVIVYTSRNVVLCSTVQGLKTITLTAIKDRRQDFITLILLFIHRVGFSKYELVFSGHIKSIVRGFESGLNNK